MFRTVATCNMTYTEGLVFKNKKKNLTRLTRQTSGQFTVKTLPRFLQDMSRTFPVPGHHHTQK